MVESVIPALAAATLMLSNCGGGDVSYGNYPPVPKQNYTAVPANDFLNSIGVNSAIASRGENIESTIDCMEYIGARWIRSGYEGDTTQDSYRRLYEELGVKFSYGLMSGSSDLPQLLAGAKQLAQMGALLAIEGNNEPNNWGVTYEGESGGGHDANSWMPIAKLHRDLYEAVKSDPVLKEYPVWSLSEPGAQVDNCGLQYLVIPAGANTTMPAGTRYADFATCHNYIGHPSWPGIHNNQTWLSSDPTRDCPVDGLYGNFGSTWGQKFSGYSDEELLTLPRVTTETGTTIDENVSEELQGLMYMSLYLAQYKRGWSYTSVYILRDRSDEAGNQSFGFFAKDYTPRLAAHYMHNLTTILADEGSISAPGDVAFEIPDMPDTVHHLLLQKSDGTFCLVVWSERYAGGSDNISINFDKRYDRIGVYNPVAGSDAVETLSNVDSVPLAMSNHPYVLEFK